MSRTLCTNIKYQPDVQRPNKHTRSRLELGISSLSNGDWEMTSHSSLRLLGMLCGIDSKSVHGVRVKREKHMADRAQ